MQSDPGRYKRTFGQRYQLAWVHRQQVLLTIDGHDQPVRMDVVARRCAVN